MSAKLKFNKPYGEKINIAYICAENMCVSQMAEAITRHKYNDIFNVYSAGTNAEKAVDEEAVRIIEQKYGFNMLNHGQKTKSLKDIPDPDIVIIVGPDIRIPALMGKYKENWNICNPIGLGDVEYLKAVDLIKYHLKKLIEKI